MYGNYSLKKKVWWIAAAVLQVRLYLCGVLDGVYRNMRKKNAENYDCVGVLLLGVLYCVCCVVWTRKGKKTCRSRASS